MNPRDYLKGWCFLTPSIVRLTKQELEQHYGWKLDRLDFFFLDRREPNAVMLQHGLPEPAAAA